MPPELDPTMNPDMGEPTDAPMDTGSSEVIGTHGDTDREGAMAKADLFKLANYAHKLYQQIHDEDQLESWVQAKITKAADYIASVYHYLEYEMKFSEYGKHLDNAETMNESEKAVLKARLMEAKMKVAELKKAHAEKVSEEKSSTGGEITRTKTGLRHSHNPDRFSDEPHAEPASKVKARSAADKAGEKAQDKADEKESKAWGKANPGKQTIMKGGVKTTNEAKKADKDYDGDGKVESGKDEYLGSKIRAAKKAGKLKEGTCSVCKKDPCVCKKEKKCNECGMYESKCECSVMESERTMSRAAKGVMKYGKDGMKALAKAGKEGKDLDAVRNKYDKYDEAVAPTKDMPKKGDKVGKEGNAFGKAVRDAKASGDKTMTVGDKTMAVKEASKPSAGLSKGEKSAVVKKAKAGGDIGKPGKSFDKVAKSAGGGEKGKKIAAAAMWKNIKETTAYVAEKKDLPGKQEKLDVDKDGKLEKSDFAALRAGKKETVKESSDFSRLQELTGRLNRSEKPMVVESREVDEIRALTKRLLG